MASKLWSKLALANGVVASNLTGGLCPGSYATSPESDWLWDRGTEFYPSCTSPGVTNNAQQCHGDPTSVIFRANGNPECLATQMSQCKFNMYNLQQLDFDISLENCLGTWAAPLWLTPDYWAGGGLSGEIDMVEICPTSLLRSNFAGVYSPYGTEVAWNYDANSFAGHVTMVIDNGRVSVNMCTNVGGECQTYGGATYENIFASNACSGHDCVYTFISDIWNGISGDGGYWGCAGGHTTPGSQCAYSIRNIRTKAAAGTFPSACSALVSGSPTPSPTPPPSPPPSPSPSGSCNVGDLVTCADGYSCMGDQCCRDGSTCPSADPSFTSCSGKKTNCVR